VRTQLDRILGSATFAEAERGRKFLRFVVELALAGRVDEIKESVVAVEVLGRATSFDPRTDPIVRVEAGRLRSRLTTYYQSEGLSDLVLVDLPKGGYVPQFQERQLPEQSPVPEAKPARLRLILAAAALCGSLATWAAFALHNEAPTLREPVLLSVLAPEGSSIINAAISPDGRHLAFTATSARSTRLWIRALGSLDSHVLAGTEDAAYPFWSPNGKTIAFFSIGKLKTMNISGGPTQSICDIPQASFGGTWGTQGAILFSTRPSGNIYQVHGEIAYLFPYFLPDGRHFLYSVISAHIESAVRIASLDSPKTKFLLNADLGTAYSPPRPGHPGSLVFAYRGALMSQQLDTNRLELKGAVSEIAPEVRHAGARADFSVSSNGTLAYQGATEKDRQLTWFDRDGREIATAGPRNAWHSMSLSPDEKRVAIEAADPSSGRSEIWVMNLDRSSLSRFGVEANEGFLPVWSPDGQEIIFSAETSSGMSLMRQAVDGINAVPLLVSRGLRIATDWSADGRFVAYTMPSGGFGGLGLWLMPTNGSSNDAGRAYSIPGHNECCAAFSRSLSESSPRWIAYSSDETGQPEVYVKALPAGDRRWQVSSGGGWLPHWRRDGRELYYLAMDGRLMAVDISAGFASVTPQALFQTTIHPYSYPMLPGDSYAVSGDGRRFLVNYALKQAASSSITISLP
jgi:Tol biopolymer transport system component